MPKRTTNRLTKRAVEATQPGTFCWDAEVPGFGVRVMPSGNRSFVFQFRTHAGESGRITLGSFPALTVDEARKLAREHSLCVEQGGNPSRDRRNAREAPTMNDLAAFYCGPYGKERGLKAQTIKDARRLLERYALPLIGSRKVDKVTVSDIRRVHSDANTGSGRYEANRLRAVLSKMFSLAIQNEWRIDNPCSGVQKYHEDQRWDYLSEIDVTALLSACDAYSDQSAANAVRLLLFTGARLREVLKADWSQFDLVRGFWEKPSHHTKTKLRHRVQLPRAALAILIAMREADLNGEFLFPGRSEGKPRSDLKRPWKALRQLAGLNGSRCHDLRRTTASFILSTGSGLATVGKTLGHTQASTTARYAHLLEDVQREGIERAVDRMTANRKAA